MAADSQTTNSRGEILRSNKIVANGGFLISGSGDAHPSDILQYIWKPPVATKTDLSDIFRFMVVKVAPSIREAIESNGYEKSTTDPDAGFTILIAFRGNIFVLEEDLSVAMPTAGIISTGTGGPFALGAVRGGASIERAMEIAAENDSSTSAPFTYFNQKK